jgi:hypothetical protein
VVLLPIRIWEWVVDKGGDHASTGVCGDRGRAMTALSLTLIAASGPASGRVVPLRLVNDASGFSYERLAPSFRADCEGGVITWH